MPESQNVHERILLREISERAAEGDPHILEWLEALWCKHKFMRPHVDSFVAGVVEGAWLRRLYGEPMEQDLDVIQRIQAMLLRLKEHLEQEATSYYSPSPN